MPTLISLTLIAYFQFYDGPFLLAFLSGFLAFKRFYDMIVTISETASII